MKKIATNTLYTVKTIFVDDKKLKNYNCVLRPYMQNKGPDKNLTFC